MRNFFKRSNVVSVLAGFCLFLASGVVYGEVIYPLSISADNLREGTVKPNVVLWDIHEVLVEKDREGQFQLAKELFPQLGIESPILGLDECPKDVTKLILSAIRDKQGEYFKTCLQLKEDIKNVRKGAPGEVYSEVMRKHGFVELADFSDDFSASYRPIRGMEQIVEQLDQYGMTQRIASNIGEPIYNRLTGKALGTYGSRLFTHLQLGKMTDLSYYGGNPIPENQLPAHLTRHSKSDPRYFAEYKLTYDRENQEVTIFIDDKRDNVECAVQGMGAIGIVFESPEQLVRDLKEIGIEVGI